MTGPVRDLGGLPELLGYRLADWQNGLARIEYTVGPAHLNRSGYLHGGMYGILLDSACAYAGTYVPPGEPERLPLTLQFTSQFIASAIEGDELVVLGRVVGDGKSHFFASGEIYNAAAAVLGTGTGVYKLRSRRVSQ